MTETVPHYPKTSDEQLHLINQMAKLANSIQRLTEMLSDRLWNDPAYEDMKDRLSLLAMIDASKSAAKELEDIVIEQW